MEQSKISEGTIQEFERFTTCDVSDALVKLGDPYGGFIPDLTMWSPERQAGPSRVVGQAYTVEYAPLADERPKVEGHYIDNIPRGSVVFIKGPRDVPNALYGGLMSMRARTSGAVGTIVDGSIRDLQEHRDLGYPVYARSIGTTSPNPLLKVIAISRPLTVTSTITSSTREVIVRPRDLIVADLNGVVVVPLNLVEVVLPLMRKQTEADEKMAEAIMGGMGFVEAARKYR